MRRFLLLILFALLSLPLMAQTVTLTAATGVVASNGVLYAQGTYSVNLVDSSGNDLTNASLTVGGVTISIPSQVGKLSATATFTIILPLANSVITAPSGTQYRLSICSINPVTQPSNVPLPPQVCFSYTTTFNSSTDLSSILSALAPPIQLPNGCPTGALGSCTISGNLAVGGSITALAIGGVCKVGPQLGSDLAAKINSCIATLGVSGGLVDATGIYGTQTASSANISIPTRTTLRLDCGVTISGTAQITLASYSAIEGCGAAGVYADESSFNVNSATIWQYTPTSGNFITSAPNAYGIKISNVRLVGPLAIAGGSGSGHGIFISPTQGGLHTAFSTVGVTFDNMNVQGFYGDGYHLEDNVYMVKCYGCSADQNGGWGWYQATNFTTVAPEQIDLFAPRFNSNGTGQIFGGGGASAGEINIFGGTLANDLSPQHGTTNFCAQFVTSSTQMNARFSGTHFEGCGKTSGTTEFIDWKVDIGSLHVQDSTFTNPASYTAIPVYLDTNFGSSVVVGPNNLYSIPSAPSIIYNANGSSSGAVKILDDLLPANIGGTIVVGFDFRNTAMQYCNVLFSINTCDLKSGTRLGFASDYYLLDSAAILYITDGGGNNLASFQPNGSPTTFYQTVAMNGAISVGGTATFNGSESHTGTVTFTNAGSVTLSGTTNTNGTLNIGNHITQGSAGKFAGTCTMSSSTSCTVTLTAGFSTAGICWATAQGASAIAASCGISGTTLTVTAASSNSLTWAALFVGNPN